MSNEETNNETETLAILGGDRPTLFETQFVEVFTILSCDELELVKRILHVTMGINFPSRNILTLLRSNEVLESLGRIGYQKECVFQNAFGPSDLQVALAKIRATVDLMGEVRMSF